MREQETPAEWTVVLPYARNPIPMNNGHRSIHAHAHIVKRVRRQVAKAVLDAELPVLARAEVELTWKVRTRADRDPSNLGGVAKAMYDGIVDARVLLDDGPAFMTTLAPRIEYVAPGEAKTADAWMELRIRSLDRTTGEPAAPPPITAGALSEAEHLADDLGILGLRIHERRLAAYVLSHSEVPATKLRGMRRDTRTGLMPPVSRLITAAFEGRGRV